MANDATGPDGRRSEARTRGEELLAIGAVADRTGMATSALRYYEDRGLIRSRRSAGGQRRYRREVIRRVAFIRAKPAGARFGSR